MTIKICTKCGLKYPMSQCPQCDGPIKRTPLTLEQQMDRLTNDDVKYIFQSIWWESGNSETRQACLVEYDKRIGLDNWPAHISKE